MLFSVLSVRRARSRPFSIVAGNRFNLVLSVHRARSRPFSIVAGNRFNLVLSVHRAFPAPKARCSLGGPAVSSNHDVHFETFRGSGGADASDAHRRRFIPAGFSRFRPSLALPPWMTSRFRRRGCVRRASAQVFPVGVSRFRPSVARPSRVFHGSGGVRRGAFPALPCGLRGVTAV